MGFSTVPRGKDLASGGQTGSVALFRATDSNIVLLIALRQAEERARIVSVESIKELKRPSSIYRVWKTCRSAPQGVPWKNNM